MTKGKNNYNDRDGTVKIWQKTDVRCFVCGMLLLRNKDTKDIVCSNLRCAVVDEIQEV